MVRFIDDHRDVYGVELICATVPIAPSTYFLHKAQHADPSQRSARAQRDDQLRVEIQRVWDANHQVYGPRKVWKQLRREGHRVRALHGPPSDGGDGTRGRRSRAGVGDHDARVAGHRPAPGSGRARLHGDTPQSAVGLGLHVRRHVARLGLCRLRDRRVRATDRRLAGVGVAAHRPGPRCARAGGLRPLPR